jgi:hypothetical protein
MASQVSPGVVIRERDLTNTTIVGSQALRAAFAGAFQKGPVETPTAINNQKELVDTFGGPVDANAEDWFVASEFLSYGGRLVVSRAVGAGVATADSAGAEVAAASPGTWGDDLTLVAVDRGYDHNVTFASAPATVADGTVLTFVGGKTAQLYNWDAGSLSGQLIQVTGGAITTADEIDIPDTGVAASGAVSDLVGTTDLGDGSYTVALSGGSSTADATLAFDVATGVVTVTGFTGGLGYVDGEVIAVTDLDLGGGGTDPTPVTFNLTVTVVDDTNAVTAVSDWYRTATLSVGTFTIKANQIGPRPGTSQQGIDLGFSNDEFHIGVVSKSTGAVLETFQYLSKLEGGKGASGSNTFFRTLVNEQSENVILAEDPFTPLVDGLDWTADASDSVADAPSGKLGSLGLVSFSLTGGDDDSYDYANDALEVFRTYDATDLDFILMGGSGALESDTLAKAGTAVSIANERKDCVAFISSHRGNQLDTSGTPLSAAACKTNILNFFSGLASTSYAVFDSGYKYLYDRFNDVYRYIPCNGDVAGLCVSTSAALADWYSPAGLSRGSLRNAVKLAYNPSQADRDDLYSERINPIISLRGSGITLFGDKTALASPSAFDRINVRRLFLNVERRVDALAQGVLFEQNDAITRNGFASAVSSYLSEVRADRGLTDFLVVCDESNNTPSVIDRNEFVADIYLQPTRSINFITITLTATRTGVSFQEVTGQ